MIRCNTEMIKTIYGECKSVQETAAVLCISKRTVERHLKKAGVKIVRHGRKCGLMLKKTSVLAEWCRQHPGTTLPRSEKKIASLTGIPLKVIKDFFYRRKKKMEKLAKKGISPNQTLVDVKGRKVNLKCMTAYKITLDVYSGVFRICVKLGKFETKIKIKLEEIKCLKTKEH